MSIKDFTPESAKNQQAAEALAGAETIKRLANSGAQFCNLCPHKPHTHKRKGGESYNCPEPGKIPFYPGWQDKPKTTDEALKHLAQGGNVGLVCGAHSNFIGFFDADENFPGFLESFPQFQHTPRVVRSNAPERGKILIATDAPMPGGCKFSRKGENKPFFEFLGQGNQGVIAGVHDSGAEILLINHDELIPYLTHDELNRITRAWTMQQAGAESSLFDEQPPQEVKANGATAGGDDLIKSVLASWELIRIFTHWGKVTGEGVRAVGDEIKILGNGGLFVDPQTQRWNKPGEKGVGGGAFGAWQWCKTGSADVPKGRQFWALVEEMAEAAGLATSANGNGYHLATDLRADPPMPEEPPDLLGADPGDLSSGGTWADIAGVIGPITWAWDKWVANGMLHIVASEPGKGKSALCLRLAACYLMGKPWPDGAVFGGELGKVLWCEAEAGQAVNLERARNWGLPLDSLLTPLADPLEDLKLADAGHVRALEAMARREDVKLIILDSLRGLHSRDENSSEVMSVVHWLAELARDIQKPIILTHHLRKRGLFDIGEAPNLDRLRGSTAITQAARLVWALDTPDPMQEHLARLSVIKSNLAKFPEPVGMTIDEKGVTFTHAPEAPKPESVADKAADLLLALLDDEPKPAAEIESEVQGAGISMISAKRAKARLGIVSIKKDDGRWYWSLPSRREYDN